MVQVDKSSNLVDTHSKEITDLFSAKPTGLAKEVAATVAAPTVVETAKSVGILEPKRMMMYAIAMHKFDVRREGPQHEQEEKCNVGLLSFFSVYESVVAFCLSSPPVRC